MPGHGERVQLKNDAKGWGPVSQLLHWLIVLLVAILAIVGLTMTELPPTPRYFWVYDLHKSTGLLVLALVLLRLGWRMYAGTPEPVAGTPRWQQRVARLTHWALYALLLAMPASGWLLDSSSGLRRLRWYGTFEVPRLVPPDEALATLAGQAHEWLFWVLLALVTLHAGAAAYHHVFRQDATLVRMLPRRWRAPARMDHEDPARHA